MLKKIPALRLIFYFFLFICGQLNWSCVEKTNKKSFVIGFSQCTTHDVWRKYMQREMERELAFHPEIKLIVKDAELSAEKQIDQIRELIDEKVDLIIASPAEAKPVTPIIEKAYSKGIPVILVDRNIISNKYSAFIGADNYKVGLDAGAYANALLRGKGNVIEIGGVDIGSSADIGRHTGFKDFIKQYPEIKYILRLSQDWDAFPAKAAQDLTKELIDNNNIQLIFTQNDRIAFGCYKVCQKLGIDKKIFIIGIDGLPGKDGGIDLVNKNMLKATILYPTGGKEAIQTAVNILENKPFQKENQLYTSIIDSSNVRMMNLQSQKILSQQNDIERQENILNEQVRIYNNQRTFNNILIVALLMVFLLGTTAFLSWKKNKRITQKLQFQNEEISRQSDQLIEMSVKAEEAHQAKLNFFTNISHEFRTPLTLILAPLGELLENMRIQPDTKQTLLLIQKNVMRLYRLVNQLMDFRKIEFRKMKLKASENDLVSFTNNIVDSYKVLAKNKNIDLRFLTSERILNVWFDITMIDKVIFNLLSNAFKFTNENGFIHITISRQNEFAVVKVEDNGIGMTQEAITHAFEPFFQGEFQNYKGTGLGLALSKELIELHHGKIMVKSEKRKGTIFEIFLLCGNAHFEETEITNDVEKEFVIHEDPDFYTIELYNKKIDFKEESSYGLHKSLSVLIIEDNAEMREYLVSKFTSEYIIIEAENSSMALQAAFDSVPDLIICDIVIPGKNGLEITQILKSDIRTSHIPIILLTARDQEAQKIEGMQIEADAYITKPFNLLFLQKTIKSLLVNRIKIKDHYSGEIFSEEKSQVSKKIDRKFISDFAAIIEKNISNEKFGIIDICNELSISRIQLYRKVKALLNCSVNDYIITTRLQKAKYYMQHEDLSISEVAFKSGFASSAYFSTVFKSKFGITPKSFKENKEIRL